MKYYLNYNRLARAERRGLKKDQKPIWDEYPTSPPHTPSSMSETINMSSPQNSVRKPINCFPYFL
jgi:hypothetical protein